VLVGRIIVIPKRFKKRGNDPFRDHHIDIGRGISASAFAGSKLGTFLLIVVIPAL